MKPNHVGSIHKIKVLTTYPEMLVRFSLQTQKETINCIISKKELADELLMLPDGTELAVYGRYNQKRQLVVVKMCVRKKKGIIKKALYLSAFLINKCFYKL
ncbi:hypothetical protein [Enterococcus faecalis]|uniref:hypothetical protein n=1 Tax=Enterococcus faecalis TaxID=1351 RepID=UPI003A8A3012